MQSASGVRQKRMQLGMAPPPHATVLWLVLPLLVQHAHAARAGEFTIKAVDAETRQPVACRMHLKNMAGRPVNPARFLKGVRLPFWRDHFVFAGEVTLALPPGTYSFELERGPEFRDWSGHFTLQRDSKDERTVEFHRTCHMAAEHWWSGDLHVHRSLEDIELLMLAEDLHVAPVITWWNNQQLAPDKMPAQPVVRFDGNRYYETLAGEDEREGGALLYFGLRQPLPLAGSDREYPSPMTFLLQARKQQGVHVDVEKPFWWDVPVWLASGLVDSVGLANNHMCRGEMLANEAWGKPRDKRRLRDPWGNGLWSQEIYYHILNCGLRLPPSAGSASGVLPNPLGYNRVYVHVPGDELDYAAWWEGLRAGRVVVTNGPLLRPQANGELPGHVFRLPAGEALEVEVALSMATRDPISYVEIVRDGRVILSVRFEELAQSGRFPPFTVEKSGWFLVRAVSDVEHTYRFASSGPWYVEVGDERAVSRRSAQFFLDWVRERMERIKLEDAGKREEVLAFHRQAEAFWQDLLVRATRD